MHAPTSPGRPHGPDTKQQNETCCAEWREVLQGMGQAFRSVTTLTLRSTFQLLGCVTVCMKPIYRRPDSPPPCLASHRNLTHDVCAMIAPALPILQDLCVEGSFESTALDVFGTSCPQLTHLRVDALDYSLKALEYAGKHLTNLACITLKTPRSPLYGRWLEGYTGKALNALRGSNSLCKLVMDFDPRIILVCRDNQWKTAPPNLAELVCTCSIINIHKAQALVGKLHTLSLKMDFEYGQYLHIIFILRAAPGLQNLSITGERKVLIGHDMISSIPFLQQRLTQGLKLSAPFIRLRGTSSIVMTLLGLLPTLPSVHSCTLDFTDSQTNDLLAHVSEVFPNLTDLHLRNTTADSIVEMTLAQLQCLTACDSLRLLRTRARMCLDTKSLAELCQSIPSLEVIGFMQCEAVDVQELWGALDAQGKAMEVEEYGKEDRCEKDF